MASSLLNIGSRSLTAAQSNLSTIAHNIANVNTAGYSRQEAVQVTAPGTYSGAGFFGRGVDIVSVKRQYDQLLTEAVRTSATAAAGDTARANALGDVDRLFANTDLGLGAALDGLFSAAADAANRPADLSARLAFLSQASQSAGRFASVGRELASYGQLADGRIAQAVGQFNDRLTDIARLNSQIARAQASGQPPNDLLDQRDAAFQSLSGLMAVTAVRNDDGSINLFNPQGTPLLVGAAQARLSVAPDPADGSRLGLRLTQGTVGQWVDLSAVGGTVGGLARFRDEDLTTLVNQVGRMAQVMAERFNTQQSQGVDANGNQGAALFSVDPAASIPNSANTGNAALAISVVDSSALQASDYQVDWNGSAFTVTRLSDGSATNGCDLPGHH